MKKILLLMAMVIGLSTLAQAQTLTWSGNNGVLDTVTNAGNRYATVQATLPVKSFSMVVVVTKISGTVGGTIKWQGSINGTDYYTIQSDNVTDGSANYSLAVNGTPAYKYYRCLFTGAGTMSASIKGVAYKRP